MKYALLQQNLHKGPFLSDTRSRLRLEVVHKFMHYEISRSEPRHILFHCKWSKCPVVYLPQVFIWVWLCVIRKRETLPKVKGWLVRHVPALVSQSDSCLSRCSQVKGWLSFRGKLWRLFDVWTYFLHFVKEPDQSGHSCQSDQAQDPHKHQYPHHLVGLGRVVITVVL